MHSKVSHRTYRLGVAVLTIVCSGCIAAGPRPCPPEEVDRMLELQAEAWNTGDIEAFMKPYWRSPDLTFSSGGQVTRGWAPVLDSYRQRYPDPRAMGHLTFSDLEFNELGEDAAFVLGHWRLEREDPVGGAFTLVLRRLDDRWMIVHDHTSRDAPQ
jgi:beta-aspartyl-peptidase (threonine type)